MAFLFTITLFKTEPNLGAKGGNFGFGTLNGNIVQVQFETYTEKFFGLRTRGFEFHYKIISNVTGEKIPDGELGRDGMNSEGIEQPRELDFISPMYALNDYKNFVRENVVNNSRESDSEAFLMDLDENKDIDSLYDAHGLFNELQGVENQYFHLARNEYAKGHPELTDDEEVLRYLYAAIHSAN